MFAYLLFIGLLGFCTVGTCGFNLDTRTVSVYSHPNRTGNDFFGFSVALHLHENARWLLVGSPLSDVTSADGKLLPKYGALFKCQTAGSKECSFVNVDNKPEKTEIIPSGSGKLETMETKSGQWLGATLRSRNGTVLVCAPRYTHKSDDSRSTYLYNGAKLRPWLSGGCYLLQSNLSLVQAGGILRPCVKSSSSYTAKCQAGFSADLSQDEGVVMGKVGWSWPPIRSNPKPLNWAGGLDLYSLSSRDYKKTPRTKLDKSDYMGYDVASGYFSDSGNTEIAGGAPRGNNIVGKVLIYDSQQHDNIVYKSQLELPKEKQVGSYYGSTLCAVDLNNDGLTDLLVGAPLYTVKKDEGRVYVYLNKKGALTLLQDTVLKGDNIKGARFGIAIASAGDLNRDGYQDVIIGAPYEGHNDSGAVYVYYGTKNGIEANYRQKISGQSINKHLKGFGYSISGAVDVDKNAYPDVAVGSYRSGHAVLLKTRRIVGIEAFVTPDRTKIVLENKNFMCNEKDGSLHKCLNLTVCFRFKDREPSNRQDLKIAYQIETDADITALEFRRIYFYNGKEKRFTMDGELTIPKQDKVHCLAPFTVHISEKYKFLNLLKPLTFDLTFSLADKACLSVPDVPCPVLDAYQPTSLRNEEVTFQKQCEGEVCKPDLSVTGRVRLPGNHQVLCVGINGVLTIDLDIENTAKDASYLSTVTLYFPADLSYIGPTSTKNVLCSSKYGNETKATCHIGNPFKAKAKKSISIEFSAQEIASSFIVTVIVASASNDTNQRNNILTLPVTTKYLTDMEITGISQPPEVIYHGKVVNKRNVKRATEIGPMIVQTLMIKNHGPSFVEGAITRIEVPQLKNKDDPESILLYLQEVELSGGPGKCNAVTNTLSIPARNTTHPYKQTRVGQNEISNVGKVDCSSAVCYSFECRLGLMPVGGSVKITMITRLWQSTFIRINQGTMHLVTTARVTVPPEVMQSNTSNDDVKITITVRPSHVEIRKEEIALWIILVSILGGLLLLALVIFIMYKCGFFSRTRPEDDALGPEETKPMKV